MQMERSRKDRRGFWKTHGEAAGHLVRLFFKKSAVKQIENDPLTWSATVADRLWAGDKNVNLELLGGLFQKTMRSVEAMPATILEIFSNESEEMGPCTRPS